MYGRAGLRLMHRPARAHRVAHGLGRRVHELLDSQFKQGALVDEPGCAAPMPHHAERMGERPCRAVCARAHTHCAHNTRPS
eukprot:6125403-Prymnesium_polylepis.1